MPLPLTTVGLYASLLVVIYLILAARIIRLRWRYRVGIGEGDAMPLKVAIRVHGNFAEYVPLALLLLGFMEIQMASTALLHVLGAALVIARISHAMGLTRSIGSSWMRMLGMILTFSVLLVSAGFLLGQYISFHWM